MTRRTAIAVLAAGIAGGCAHDRPDTALTLDDLIRRHTLARGGAGALDRVRSCLIHVEIVERGQTINGRYAADVGGLVRIDIYAGGAWVGSEGVDQSGVWLRSAGQPARASVATGGDNALLHGAEMHLFGLHRFPDRGHRLRLMPPETVDGTRYEIVEARFSTGHIVYFYVDPASGLITRRRDERAFHPDLSLERQRVETLHSDFQAVDGVVAPHRNRDIDLATGNLLATNRVLRRVLNPDLPSNLFDRAYEPPTFN